METTMIKCSIKARNSLKKQAIDKGMTFFEYMNYVANKIKRILDQRIIGDR